MNDSTKSNKEPTIWAPSLQSALLAAILGGAIGLAILQTVDPIFPYPDLPEVPNEPTAKDAELIAQHVEANGLYFAHNYAASFAIIGACLGGAIGYLTVVARKLPSMLAGGLAGALGGSLTSLFRGTPIGGKIQQGIGYSLVEAGYNHMPVWMAMLCGLSLAIGFVQGGSGQALKGAIAGLVAGIVAPMLYLFMASAVFLGDNMGHLIPTSMEHRIAWLASTCALAGIFLWYGLRPSGSPNSAAPAPEDDRAQAREP